MAYLITIKAQFRLRHLYRHFNLVRKFARTSRSCHYFPSAQTTVLQTQEALYVAIFLEILFILCFQCLLTPEKQNIAPLLNTDYYT